MVEKLVAGIIGLLGTHVGDVFICFIISMFPILELRGGLLAASPAFLNVPLFQALPVCIIGNLLPVPFVLLFIEKILEKMEDISFTSKVAKYLRDKSEKNKDSIVKYGFWGLVVFVGLPLPGTGAWTGSMIAALLHIPKKRAFAACVLGMLMASVIMCVISYGILGALFPA